MTNIDIELEEVVETVWTTTLGSSIHKAEGDPTTERDAGAIEAVLDIIGEEGARVVLECSERMAREAAACMFGVKPADADSRDLCDAVGELVNIIAGNIRGLISTPSKLGLPSVHEVSGAEGAATQVAAGEALYFECKGMPFQVALIDPQ